MSRRIEIEQDIFKIVAKHVNQASIEVERKYGTMHFTMLKENEVRSFKNGVHRIALGFTRTILRSYYDVGGRN